MLKTIWTSLLALALVSSPALADTAVQAPQVRLETSLGNIVLTLDPEKAPATVANFLNYVKAGHYDGTIFHRVIKGFMIQGGGFDAQMTQKAVQKPIPNEAANGLTNLKGSIAMARTTDPHSATAQFFINTVDNDFLNHRAKNAKGWGYCVFGKVSEGMAVVQRIEQVTTTRRGRYRDVPATAVVINKAVLVEKPKS